MNKATTEVLKELALEILMKYEGLRHSEINIDLANGAIRYSEAEELTAELDAEVEQYRSAIRTATGG